MVRCTLGIVILDTWQEDEAVDRSVASETFSSSPRLLQDHAMQTGSLHDCTLRTSSAKRSLIYSRTLIHLSEGQIWKSPLGPRCRAEHPEYTTLPIASDSLSAHL